MRIPEIVPLPPDAVRVSENVDGELSTMSAVYSTPNWLDAERWFSEVLPRHGWNVRAASGSLEDDLDLEVSSGEWCGTIRIRSGTEAGFSIDITTA